MSMKTRILLIALFAASLAGLKAAAQTPGLHRTDISGLGKNSQVITNITKETFITAVWSPTNPACWTDGDGNKWAAALTNGLSVWFSADAFPSLFGTATNEFPFIINPTTPPGEEGGLTLRGYISEGFHVIDGGSPLHKWKNATKDDFNYPITLLPQGEAAGTATVGFAVRMATNRIDGVVFESHAATGAVLQASLSALAAYADTNKVTRFYDAADPAVWWVSRGGTNMTSYTTAMSWVVACDDLTIYGNPVMSAHSVTRPDIPHPLPAEGYYPLTGEITIGVLDGSVTTWLPDETYWGGLNYEPIDSYTFAPGAPGGAGAIRLTWQTVTNLVGSYNLTTGNVWQAVADVQQTADDALLAADQAGTLINYHTTLDAAPHAGKFVTPGQLTNALAAYPTFAQVNGIVYSNSVSALTIYTNASGAATSWWQVASGVTNSGTFASGATNITDGVTSGTYSEATRTLNISNLLAGVSMELPDGIVTNGMNSPVTLGKIFSYASDRVGIQTTADNGVDILQVNGQAVLGSNVLVTTASTGANTTRKKYNGVPLALEIQFGGASDGYAYPMAFFNNNPAGGNYIFTSFGGSIGAAAAGDVMVENSKGGIINYCNGDQRCTVGTSWSAIPVWTAKKATQNMLVGTKTDNGTDKLQVNGAVKATSIKAIHKTSNGTSAVADGTYTVGIGTNQNGTITITDGIITAIQQAQ